MNVFILGREEMMNLLQRKMVPRGHSGNYMVTQLRVFRPRREFLHSYGDVTITDVKGFKF